MLDWSIEQKEHPVVIRIPRGRVIHTNKQVDRDYSDINKYQITQKGRRVAILALGDFYPIGEDIYTAIQQQLGYNPTLINPRYASGLDIPLLNGLKENHEIVITLEDSILDGGFGQKISSFYGTSNMKVFNYGLKKEFLDGYDAKIVLAKYGISVEAILNDIVKK